MGQAFSAVTVALPHRKINMSLNRRQFALTTLAAAAFSSVATVRAQAFPSKPLRIVVPFAPGGPVDVMARILGPKLTALLGQPVLIDNRPGAATIIGAEAVVKAAPDGHTLYFAGVGGRTILPAIAAMPFDAAKDLLPVTPVASAAQVFVISTNMAARGVKSLKDLVKWAQANPGKLNIGSVGAGTITSLVGDLWKRENDIKAVDIPFRGGAPAVTALLAGEIDFLSADIAAVMPQIQANKLVGLAVTSPKRHEAIRDVPSVLELGQANLVALNVYGLQVPAGTPAAIIAQLAQAVAKALTDPNLKAQFATLGVQPGSTSPAEFERFLVEQSAKWQPLARALGVRVN